ncbi:MAG: hypothetical protein QE285_10885 [Aquabacterium sp.]|nr:hypothetical protein [Aquabacterium sp.]
MPHTHFRLALPAAVVRHASVATLIGLAAALAGCAVLQPAPPPVAGQAEAQVLASRGTPTSRYTLPAGGQRLEYATGPYGRTTLMVDLGSDGRVTTSAQVLTEANFAKVHDGMPRDAVLRLLGRPAEKAGEYMDRQTWSWRYPTYDCLWARITFEPDGKVRGGASLMPDPRCDVDY